MSPVAIALVIGVLPLAWSGLVWALRLKSLPQDGAEKAALVLMLAPIGLGLAAMAIARLVPDFASVPLPPLVEAVLLDDASMIAGQGEVEPVGSRGISVSNLILLSVFGVYLMVLSWKAVHLFLAQVALWRIARQAHPCGQVRVSDAHIPPMALRGRIILPARLLRHLTSAQIDLIVAHERAHQRRSDTLYYPFLSWLDVMFWFNPAFRAQTRRCREAAELACDARVMKERPDMRRDYAEALLLTLKHTAGDVRQHTPAAYSPANSGEFRMRMIEILRPLAGKRKSRTWTMLGAALLLIPVAGAQLAWSQGETPASVSEPVFTVVPVAGSITSPYGMRDNPVTGEYSMHDAVDIASPIGTPVYAPAAGRVIRADIRQPWFGYVLEIAHADGYVTRYMHLDHIDVKVGDEVAVGQTVAASGNTGRSTGPHTHIALFKDGQPIDPASLIPMPTS